MSSTVSSEKHEERKGQEAVVPASEPSLQEKLVLVHGLPCQVTLDLPVLHFKVADLLHLSAGMVFETGGSADTAIPVRVNGREIALSDLQATGDQLAFRVTEIL